MSFYSELDSHIRYKVKLVLDLSNNATKRYLNQVRCVKTSNLAAKGDFTALKADKLGLSKIFQPV